MKDKIKQCHHNEYIHIKCCFKNLYDVKLRIEFIDYMEIMRKHPMGHQLSLNQRIMNYFHQFHYFVFESDQEILFECFQSVHETYKKLKELNANEEILKDYCIILDRLQKSLKERGLIG